MASLAVDGRHPGRCEEVLLGLHKYTKTDNASIKSVQAETMEWWNYDASDGFSLQKLYKWIQQKQTDQYKNIQELTDTRERTLLTILPDTNFGDRFWLVLPGFQDTLIEDLWED